MARFPEDLKLAREVAAGNEAALACFYERHADGLFAFILHLSGARRQDGEDLWQESLLAGLKSIHTYRGDSALFTWLCSIARHKILDGLRKPSLEHERPLDTNQAELPGLIDGAPLPDDLLLAQDTKIRVVLALATLPDQYRRALVARYADDRTVEEVAAMLGRSYKATESLLSRAREEFRRAIAVGAELAPPDTDRPRSAPTDA